MFPPKDKSLCLLKAVAMKKWITLVVGIILFGMSSNAYASLEIFCPKDKDITYQTYQAGNYWDKPSVWGPHTLYGPWIKPNLNCGAGYVEIKWEIVDHYARSYYCTQTIWVTNHYGSAPISVWCPKEEWIYCDQLDYIKYNKPEVSGSNYWIYGPYVSKSLNDCGIGSVWVEWKVVDGCGKTTICKSVIWVKARGGYPNIWWPKDFEADACVGSTDPKYLSYPYGYPDISSKNSCSHYGISYKDEEYTFPNDPGICRKIARRWSVIDWCTYNPNAYGYQTEGRWEHVQLIKLVSKSKPSITCTPEVKVGQELYGKTAWVDVPVPTATSSCNGKSVISHNSKYATNPYSADASGQYPIGTTEVIFSVKDGCANYSTCTTKVIVLDKTAPTPYCLGTLVAGIGWHSDGIYTVIDPKKFDAGSYDNCTPKEKLKFTAVPSRYTCDSIGIKTLKIWVEDEAGNKDYCTVKLNLQDNSGMCPKPVAPPAPPAPPVAAHDSLLIAGFLWNMYEAPLDSVMMTLADSAKSKSLMVNGQYKFQQLKKDIDYSVSAYKSKGFFDGVTDEDYDLLVNYIQGDDSLFSPYQLIAADIDGNDTVDMDDAFLLGYYLLTKGQNNLGSQPAWRFFPKSFNLASLDILGKNISSVPDFIKLRKLDSICIDADFIGVKIGDINLSLFDTSKLTSTIPKLEARDNKQPIARVSNSIDGRVKVYPNPFRENLTILYHSEQHTEINVTWYDISGKSFNTQKVLVNKGINQLKVEKGVFRYPGIYFYNIKDQFNNFSGKVHLLD